MAETSLTTLHDVQTPCLLLDETRMTGNIERMRTALAAHRVPLRPHLKTSKSIEVARRLVKDGCGPATVSTLAEAEYFASHGLKDVLYAVGLTASKLDRVAALREQGVDLSVVVDNVAAARSVAEYSRQRGAPIPALIEIDCDGRRAGVSPDDSETLLEIGRVLFEQGARLRGVLTHAGASYDSRSLEEIQGWARREVEAATVAAQVLEQAHLSCPVVSVGSTPTALCASSLQGVTEVRAGVFVFFDLVMAGIGVCQPSDIALSVLTTVIDVQPRKSRYIVDAGWMAMSRDRGTASQAMDCGYGLVCDVTGNPFPDVLMLEANQEHGVIGLPAGSGSSLPSLRAGDRVRILPNHACATAAQHGRYQVVQGASPRILDQWGRIRGW